MICAWDQLLGILPDWLAKDVDRYGRRELQEVRLRIGQVPELVLGEISLWCDRIVSKDDINFVINTASRYSPWAASSLSRGYLTAAGGHRIGVCGEAVTREGEMVGIRHANSLCIRVARDFSGICGAAAKLKGSVLLIGPPCSGKTSLLRDLARSIAGKESVGVVDERGELFPEGICRGRRMDVLSGCSKPQGVEIILRTMSPTTIAVDEITSEADCVALLQAGWCGVRLIATAHAENISDLRQRAVYRTLVSEGLFEHVLVLGRDKSWREERMAV